MGKSLQDDILELLAVSIRASKQALINLRGDGAYLWKTVSQMKKQGIVSINKSDLWTIRLTKKGVAEVNKINEALFDYYMQYSCDNKPGSTIAHKKAQCKASELIAIMKQIGVRVGIEKPERDVRKEGRMSVNTPSFYLLKELKFERGQKVSRTQISRATGIIMSKGINALVYNTQDEILRVNSGAEKTTKGQIQALHLDVYRDHPAKFDTQSCLVVGKDYDIAGLLYRGDTDREDKRKEKRKTKTLHDAIFDPTVTGGDVLYVPETEEGMEILKLLLKRTPAQIKELFFTEEERTDRTIKEDKIYCDAIVNGRPCFELVTMNLSKIAKIAMFHKNDIENIAISCLRPQLQVLSEMLGVGIDKLHYRAYELDILQQLNSSIK